MKKQLLGAAAAALLLGVIPGAHAVPTLSLSDSDGPTVTCADGDLCDQNALTGVVTFIGGVGDFIINVTTGITKPVYSGSPLMDLNSVNVQTQGSADTLTLMFTETGFVGDGADWFSGSFAGTIESGATVTASAYYSTTDQPFALTTQIASMGPFGSPAFAATFIDGPEPDATFSVTQVITLTTVGPTSFSGDFVIRIPEPASLALLGLGLLAAGFGSRRRAV